MFVQLRAPGTGASIAFLCLGALAAALYFGPWRPASELTAEAHAAPAAPDPMPADGILRIGLESPLVHDAGDGIVHLGVRVTPPRDAAAARTPVALALVLDSSPSMAGLAMEHARFAARSVVERLGEGDRVTVINFDYTATVAVPLTPPLSAAGTAGKSDRRPILDAIDAIELGSSTALHAGVVAGLAALAPAGDMTRRLILVSDGQANVGPDTPAAVTAALDPGGVTLSTIGVGTDYDEAIMLAVADHGRGGFHHLADPVQLADIVDAELKSARAVVARDATIELHPAPGVELVDVAGLRAEALPGGGFRVLVGELYAGESRALTLALRVPTRRPIGDMPLFDTRRPVGAVQLAYSPVDGSPAIQRTAQTQYLLTASLAKVRAAEQPTWMVAADRMRVSHVLVDAAALLQGGDLLEAQAILRDERARLQSRRSRTAGGEQVELDGLIALLADPYVDARLDGTAAPVPADSPDADARFAAALDAARHGRPVADAELAGLPADRLRIVRNGAYARHGYPFKSSDLQRFFGQTGWYAADRGFDPSRLSPTDVQNVARIKQYEGGASITAAARPAPTPTRAGPGFDPLFERARQGQPIADAELDGLDLGALRRLRNAAYARHGYAFRSTDLQRFFEATGWYAADPSYAPSHLTPEDGENVRRIKAREQALVARAGGAALRDFELRSRANARRALR